MKWPAVFWATNLNYFLGGLIRWRRVINNTFRRINRTFKRSLVFSTLGWQNVQLHVVKTFKVLNHVGGVVEELHYPLTHFALNLNSIFFHQLIKMLPHWGRHFTLHTLHCLQSALPTPQLPTIKSSKDVYEK